MDEQQGRSRNIVNHRRSRRSRRNGDLIPSHPRSLPFHDAQPYLDPELMPCWFGHYRVLQKSFKDICRLVFRSGFQAIHNLEALTLFNEGITNFTYLQRGLPSSHRCREENIHALSTLEAKVTDFRDNVIQALRSYDQAINLDETVELDISSESDEEEEQLTSDSENEPDAIMEDEEHEEEDDIDDILNRIEQEGGAANLDESIIILN